MINNNDTEYTKKRISQIKSDIEYINKQIKASHYMVALKYASIRTQLDIELIALEGWLNTRKREINNAKN